MKTDGGEEHIASMKPRRIDGAHYPALVHKALRTGLLAKARLTAASSRCDGALSVSHLRSIALKMGLSKSEHLRRFELDREGGEVDLTGGWDARFEKKHYLCTLVYLTLARRSA